MLFKSSFAPGGSAPRRARRLILTVTLTSLLCGCASSSPSPTTTANRPTSAPAAAAAQRGAQQVTVHADDAMLRKPYAVIGGAVENTSGAKLEGVSVELELQKRADGSKERRSVAVNPNNLGPGERGTYSLKILSQEWSDSRVVSVKTGDGKGELAFRTVQGARRPPERLPDKVTVTETVQGPKQKKKSGGEEFINTPDDAVSVP